MVPAACMTLMMMMINHRPLQYRTTDSHCTKYSDVLVHASHTAHIKDSFSVTSSTVMCYLLLQPSIKGNAGPIANVLERFCNIHSSVNQWRQSCTASEKLTIIRYAEAHGNSSWASMRWRLSYNVALTGCDADWPYTIPVIYIAQLAYIKAILVTPRDHLQ